MINSKFVVFLFVRFYFCEQAYYDGLNSKCYQDSKVDPMSLKSLDRNKKDVWNITLVNLTLFTNNSIDIKNIANPPIFSYIVPGTTDRTHLAAGHDTINSGIWPFINERRLLSMSGAEETTMAKLVNGVSTALGATTNQTDSSASLQSTVNSALNTNASSTHGLLMFIKGNPEIRQQSCKIGHQKLGKIISCDDKLYGNQTEFDDSNNATNKPKCPKTIRVYSTPDVSSNISRYLMFKFSVKPNDKLEYKISSSATGLRKHFKSRKITVSTSKEPVSVTDELTDYEQNVSKDEMNYANYEEDNESTTPTFSNKYKNNTTHAFAVTKDNNSVEFTTEDSNLRQFTSSHYEDNGVKPLLTLLKAVPVFNKEKFLKVGLIAHQPKIGNDNFNKFLYWSDKIEDKSSPYWEYITNRYNLFDQNRHDYDDLRNSGRFIPKRQREQNNFLFNNYNNTPSTNFRWN